MCLLESAQCLIQVGVHRADTGNHDSAAVASQGVTQHIGEDVVPVGGFLTLHQGVYHPPQHQQATVDASSLALLLPLSPRLG